MHTHRGTQIYLGRHTEKMDLLIACVGEVLRLSRLSSHILVLSSVFWSSYRREKCGAFWLRCSNQCWGKVLDTPAVIKGHVFKGRSVRGCKQAYWDFQKLFCKPFISISWNWALKIEPVICPICYVPNLANVSPRSLKAKIIISLTWYFIKNHHHERINACKLLNGWGFLNGMFTYILAQRCLLVEL